MQLLAHATTLPLQVLLPAETGFIEMDGSEKSYKLKQAALLKEVDLNTAKNAMDLQLTKFGPYRLNYSRNGRFMLFAGQKGHVAVVDCQRTKVGAELQLQEEVHDAHFLHNHTLFAVAQNKYTYIYDHKGAPASLPSLSSLPPPPRMARFTTCAPPTPRQPPQQAWRSTA